MELNVRFFLIVTELVLSFLCFIIAGVSGGEIAATCALLIYGSIGGYTVICSVLLVGHFLGSVVDKYISALFSILGCFFFILSGALLINTWSGGGDLGSLVISGGLNTGSNALATASFMIINGVVFLVDAVFIIKPSYLTEFKAMIGLRQAS